MAQNHHGERYSAAVLTDAADELEAMGKCGFCGREVYSSLKPMCGDCAGREDPATVALQADLAKAREEAGAVAAQHHRRERDLEHERNLAQMRSRELESSLAKAKEREATLAEKLNEVNYLLAARFTEDAGERFLDGKWTDEEANVMALEIDRLVFGAR